MHDHTTKIPSIPEPAPNVESIGITVRALMHAVDILALNGSGSPNHQIFVRRQDFEQLKAEFDAYRKAHP